MSIGMTYDEFWHGEPSMVRAYRKAWEIKKHNEEYDRWRLGYYVYTSLLCVAPVLRAFTKGDVKPGNYPNQPFPLTEKEAQEREEQEHTERMKRMLAQLTKESDERKKQEVSINGDD